MCFLVEKKSESKRGGTRGGMETQSVMMIPSVIYNQMRLKPRGSLLDYPS